MSCPMNLTRLPRKGSSYKLVVKKLSLGGFVGRDGITSGDLFLCFFSSRRSVRANLFVTTSAANWTTPTD